MTTIFDMLRYDYKNLPVNRKPSKMTELQEKILMNPGRQSKSYLESDLGQSGDTFLKLLKKSNILLE